MRVPLPFCLSIAALLPTGALLAADPPKPLDEPRLLSRVRAVCLRPISFDADAMRRPLRLDPEADLKAARAEVSEKPADLDAHWHLAEAAEAVGAPESVSEWQIVAAMCESRLRGKSPTPDLPEKQVIALVGANAGTRAVPAAERLASAQPRSWKAHLLCGDAHMRRADHNWRVALRLLRANTAPPPALGSFREDLLAAQREYERAIELAPAEMDPRSGRIALELARPLLVGLLPKGTVAGAETSNLALVREDLLQVAERDGVPGLWHAASYFLERPGELSALTEAQRASIERLLLIPAKDTERVFSHEANGMWRLALGKPADARKAFEVAHGLAKDRRIAAGWLAWLDSHARTGRAETLARLREEAKTAPSAETHSALAALASEENLSDALSSAREAVRLSVRSQSARYLLALLLLRKDVNAEEARYHLGQLKNLAPDDHEATFLMLFVSAIDGERKAASLALQELAASTSLDEDLRVRIRETIADLAAK